jgi:hypothetical protein
MLRGRWVNDSEPFDQDPTLAKRLKELHQLRLDWAERGNSPEKDAAAQTALNLAGTIFEMTAGWALNHRANLASEDLRPSDTPGRPDPYSYVGAVRPGRLTPVQGRRFVRDLLTTIGDNLSVPDDFVEALEALDHGQVLPPLEKAQGRDRLGLAEWQARLTALCYIEYSAGKGMKKLATSEEVAKLFAVNRESMKDWRSDVGKRLGKRFVDDRLRDAQAAGKLYRGFGGQSDAEETARDVYEDTYGMEVLMRAAEAYKSRGQ